MDWNPVASLNFKHLHYFWMVARSGSIASASKHLHLTPQSISSQLSELEGRLGVELFRRVGRGLELTETGQRIFSYADEIFALGDELLEVALDQTVRKSLPFRVGIANSVPKSLAYRVVEPALRMAEPVRLLCREGRLAPLLAEMAVHHLDLVIADQPMPNHLNVRGYSHFLGESDLTVFAAPQLAQSLAGDFPVSLNRAPFLLPGDDVALRPDLLRWFEAQRLYPHIVGEFEDSALLKAFGQAGAGLFVAPTAIADYVTQQYTVQAIGRIEAVTERLYAITTERRLLHPAIVAVVQATQREFFGKSA
ncbi:Transcriptional regulator, LysR family [Candidatus Competibacter denitrificans Run_A_D11]|uniref:Transcriptional regulator, LysR family n=1 Tax=Candidatus Competibacter denitrificans Run_A_D11 TaxID=1400863 RepID=W6M746_9GAMM|nr:transcriptional activator NhaR [Candidatus Competibacter denitrificans]CDI03507.1 Transcriptional regulator, LysR family [Candidatus Competibacter denitrificans Run_A_D11]